MTGKKWVALALSWAVLALVGWLLQFQNLLKPLLASL